MENKPNQIAKAQIKYLRISPRKVRLVSDMIKGLPVDEAQAQLLFNRRRPAKALLKLLNSAINNAKNKHLDTNFLMVKNIIVNNGPKLKRYLPRARGVANIVEKKMSHVYLVLEENKNLTPKYNMQFLKKEKKHKPEHEKIEKKELKPKKPTDIKVNPKEEIKETAEKELVKKPGFMRRIFSPKSRASK